MAAIPAQPFTAPAVKPLTIRRWNASTNDGHRQRGHDSGGEHLAPRHLILTTEERDGDGYRLAIGPKREREREQELVPRVQERQDGAGCDARRGQRQHDLERGPRPAGSVHHRGFLEIARQLPEERRHQPDGERHRKRHVREHEAWVGIDEVRSTEDQEERREDGNLREDGDRQDGGSHHVPPSEAKPSNRICRRRADHDRQHRRGPRDDERVDDGHPEAALGEEGLIVNEHGSCGNERLVAEQTFVGRDRRGEHPVQRKGPGGDQQPDSRGGEAVWTAHASSPGVRSNRTYTSASANVSTNVTIDSADP